MEAHFSVLALAVVVLVQQAVTPVTLSVVMVVTARLRLSLVRL
jgi:hypothetical protein